MQASVQQARDGQFELAYLIGFALSFLLYGVYLCGFLMSLVLAWRHRRAFTPWWTKILYLANLTLFIIATVFTAINFLRLVRAFTFDPLGPFLYLLDPDHSHWESFASGTLIFLMLNIGDALVIHRCYIVWLENIYVVLMPIILATLSFGAGCVFFVLYGHPSLAGSSIPLQLLLAIYLLHFTQNVLTTGMIVARIWKHHMNSSSAGVRPIGARLSLASVARIIAESAMIYTLQLLLLIVLSIMGSCYVTTVMCTMAPTIGLVFNVIAARIYIAQSSDMEIGRLTNILQPLSAV